MSHDKFIILSVLKDFNLQRSKTWHESTNWSSSLTQILNRMGSTFAKCIDLLQTWYFSLLIHYSTLQWHGWTRWWNTRGLEKRQWEQGCGKKRHWYVDWWCHTTSKAWSLQWALYVTCILTLFGFHRCNYDNFTKWLCFQNWFWQLL